MKLKKKTSGMPETCMLQVCGVSGFGDLLANTVIAEDNPKNEKIYVLENKKIKPALEKDDKFLAKVICKKNVYWAKPLLRTEKAQKAEGEKIYGIIEQKNNHLYLKLAEKNSRLTYLLDEPTKVKNGDFVSAFLEGDKKFKRVKILKNYGPFNLNKATSALILDKYEIPAIWEDKVVKELKQLKVFDEKFREDITNLPLVTIDGDDSKDFDDAVYASKTLKGFDLVVAIADVAFYVRDFSELDREAYKRGNSVYLPNMVVPMLPEKLSNDLCSLNPNEKRPCIACFMKIDNQGNLLEYRFSRAVMKSSARLTYREVQNAIDGKLNDKTTPLFKKVIQPLYEAYFALDKARKCRGALELETTEIKIKLDKFGNVKAVEKAEHFISNQIIEEFMIIANVAAAKFLEKTKLPVMYRVHEKPLEEKLKELIPLLQTLKMKLPDINALKPEHLNIVMNKIREKDCGDGVSELILRLQCQAKYNPKNVGHFGLGLSDYVHFTSPIRRYSDLLIHRAIIKAQNMPDGGGLADDANEKLFEEIGEHLCTTERKAVNAERDITSRFLSAYLEPSIGADFDVKIRGITTAGLFVAIESIGAEGLIPMRTLPDDDYEIAASALEMIGKNERKKFAFGDKIKARLMEASPISGGLVFKLVDGEKGIDYYEKGKTPLKFRKKVTKPKKERKKILKNKNENKKKKIKSKK